MKPSEYRKEIYDWLAERGVILNHADRNELSVLLKAMTVAGGSLCASCELEMVDEYIAKPGDYEYEDPDDE